MSDQEVRWCPGCGDYSILAQTQKVMPDFGYPKENIVFISGIGCSGRLPYYMNTYGFHSIHGRAPAIATGLKAARPDLMVWVITGDGDALSIGGNHLVHALRRNVDLRIIMFNNRIYGLTKGQASPTSEFGKVTKSSPYGTVDYPVSPLAIALAAEATLIARSVDTHTEHLQGTLEAAGRHRGSAFVEVLQNCNIFNDGAHREFTDREVRDDRMLFLEHGKPMIFGKDRDKGIRLKGHQPEIVTLGQDGDHRGRHPRPRRDRPTDRLHARPHLLAGVPGPGRDLPASPSGRPTISSSTASSTRPSRAVGGATSQDCSPVARPGPWSRSGHDLPSLPVAELRRRRPLRELRRRPSGVRHARAGDQLPGPAARQSTSRILAHPPRDREPDRRRRGSRSSGCIATGSTAC